MSQNIPIVVITPEAKAALGAEVERGGVSGELTGGLLFGYPLDQRQRLVVSSIRLSADVGFGQRDFAIDQSRTTRQLEHAQSLDPKATYCGVWYLHRTPNRELTDEEWVQAQTLLEDPDFRFEDLICLVLCFYYGELKIYASSFNRYHSARGQSAVPTQLLLTTDRLSTQSTDTHPAPAPSASRDWFKSLTVAARLDQEQKRLAEEYQVEPALAPDGQMFFRLTPKRRYDKLVFYLACGPGYPDNPPNAFLRAGDKPYPLSSPGLGNWSVERWLVEVADELVKWLVFSLEEYLATAEDALRRGDYAMAADLLTVVLAIEPRTPRAARLLAQAQAPLGQ
jgi:hypothetical protein